MVLPYRLVARLALWLRHVIIYGAPAGAEKLSQERLDAECAETAE